MNAEATYQYLTDHGVKPSMQRMAVMDYLLQHHTHPTIDEIYTSLLPEMPTLSRTTIYNTLHLLAAHKAVTQLTIDERRVCYDADVQPHAHFLCTRCGHVFDLPLKRPRLEGAAQVPDGFQTEQCDLYYRGCCKECAAHEGAEK